MASYTPLAAPFENRITSKLPRVPMSPLHPPCLSLLACAPETLACPCTPTWEPFVREPRARRWQRRPTFRAADSASWVPLFASHGEGDSPIVAKWGGGSVALRPRCLDIKTDDIPFCLPSNLVSSAQPPRLTRYTSDIRLYHILASHAGYPVTPILTVPLTLTSHIHRPGIFLRYARPRNFHFGNPPT